jgi:hypothetical protein
MACYFDHSESGPLERKRASYFDSGPGAAKSPVKSIHTAASITCFRAKGRASGLQRASNGPIQASALTVRSIRVRLISTSSNPLVGIPVDEFAATLKSKGIDLT